VAEAFYKQSAVRVEHNFDDCRVFESDAQLIAERILELADKSWMGAKLGHAALLSE
jgi:hypothetical protein